VIRQLTADAAIRADRLDLFVGDGQAAPNPALSVIKFFPQEIK